MESVEKKRLIKEGNESVTNCNQLKLQSEDGKYYKTDVGNVENLRKMEEKKTLAIFEPLMNGVKANLDGLFAVSKILEQEI